MSKDNFHNIQSMLAGLDGCHGGASCAPVAADQGGRRGEGVGRAAVSPVGRVRYSDVPDDFKHRQLFNLIEFE